MIAQPLSCVSLQALAGRVATPRYDPAAVTPGIVHLGFGGFHRAHMARYTHDLMDACPAALEWGIIGAGLLPADKAMREALAPQDNLYTLVERSGTVEAVTVIGVATEIIFVGLGALALLEAIDRPEIRIVSLTVTENGYGLDPATRRLDASQPGIARDLSDPRDPVTAIGVIVEAYRRRRRAGAAPFTALSCDNIQHNGDVLRAAVLDYAELVEPDLRQWIETSASFPNTMVDRITPATVEADIAALAERHGIADRWPVFSETFRQWVIEDRFVAGRPAWEEVGAHFVEDVAPYEFMKLRLLNASHLAVSGLGRLIGYHHVHEAMGDERLRSYMKALMDRETGPTLLPMPGIDLTAYKATLIDRFANPAIRDTVERVNTDAPVNVLLDPIRDRLRAGESIDLLALGLAAWLRRVRGEDEAGAPIDVRHPLAADLRTRATQGGSDPRPLLGLRALFGDLGESDRLVESVGRWLDLLYAVGAARTLEQARAECGF